MPAQPVIPGFEIAGSSGPAIFTPYSETNPLPISGSFTATMSGFAPGGTAANLSVTSTTGNTALPAGTVVVITNTGDKVAYVKLGGNTATAATTDLPILPNTSVPLTVGTNTYLAGICAGSDTTTLNLQGGSGVATGWGASSGATGSGAVTMASGAVSSGAYTSGSFAAGAIIDIGTGGSPAANTVNARLGTIHTDLVTINSALGAPMQNSGGSVSLSGSLPAFAATPTVNLGTLNGAATAANQASLLATINGKYQTIAASQTTATVGGGAQGNLITAILVIPATTSPGSILLRDGTSGSDVTLFAGGASSVSGLIPFPIPVGAVATAAGGWKITTGANISVFVTGNW